MDGETDMLSLWFHLPLDPRTKDWVMVKYPSIIVLLTGLYLYFVKVWGPAYMKGRPPYDLKLAIKVYNGLNVVLSAGFLAVVLSLTYVGGGYSLFCQGTSHCWVIEITSKILEQNILQQSSTPNAPIDKKIPFLLQA